MSQFNTDYTNSGTITDSAIITASGVDLINTDSGRIYGGVSFAAGGSTLINQLGGVIRLSQFEDTTAVLVAGSSGDDTVINAGLIGGRVDLGGGNDTFVERDSTTFGVELGSGNDTYRVEGTIPHVLSASGGDGQDRLVLAGTSNQYWSGNLTGFEDLVFEAGGNFSGFSGYQSITLAWTPVPFEPLSFVNLLDCLNPAAIVTMSGQWLILQNSSVRSVVGSDQNDAVELGFNNSVEEGISLGAGDDGVTITSHLSTGAPTVPIADGGAGSDTLTLNWHSAGDRSYDLSSVQSFEKLNVNSWYIVDPAIARVSGISGLTDIDIGQRTTLILSNSISPNARAGGAFGGGLTLEAGTVIDRYGFPEGEPWDSSIDIAQGDPARSTNIINHGTINHDVRFYIGDDLYDGRDGSVGGTIYGNAGNDTLLGGAAGETMAGGFGADILEGNGGADVLTGGAGSDSFRGTVAGLNNDTINDFSAGDRIVFTDATLGTFTFSLAGSTLTYSGGSLTLGASVTGAIVASAASGGGVQLTITDVRNDFNGDGRSDVLWRSDAGELTNSLGRADGGFVNNGANAWFTSLASNWQVVGTGDFNGDGKDDLLWRSSSGEMTNWLGQANGGFGNNGANAWFAGLTATWQVAGTGDFNGDGRDDIMWRSASGEFSNWLGTATGGFTNNGTNSWGVGPASWQIVAIGDFNGDGRDDVLWRSDAGQMTDWLGQANGGFANNGANAWFTASATWHVVGTGDFNGDGRDDLMWRSASGEFSNWLGQANGSFVNNGANSWGVASTSWHIAGIGDYNGDGRDDLLWRSDSGGISNQLANANGGFTDNGANAWNAGSTSWDVLQPDTLWV